MRYYTSTSSLLKALPTCLEYTDWLCVSMHCINCSWCPTLNRCSTGTDRKKQDWLSRGCDRNLVTEENFCPAIGQKGNNANHNDTTSTPVVDGTESTSTTEPSLEKSKTDFHTGT
ncbi:hypothetical protein DOY81_010130, partial [Sarcophaga bullata]